MAQDLALRLTFLPLRDIVFHFPQRVEQFPREHYTGYLHERDQERGSRDRGADDLGVNWRHFSTSESFVRFLVGEVAGRAVVAVQAARQRQVVPPTPVVSRVVGSTAPQLPLDPSELLEDVRVGLRVVVSIVHCILDESVRVFTVDVHEDEGGRDHLSDNNEDHEEAVDTEHAAALAVGAAPAAEGHHHDEQSEQDEEPWRDLRPVHPVVQQVMVAVPEADELGQLHKEPDPGRGGH